MSKESEANTYALINAMRIEIKGDISAAFGTLSQQQGKLENKFDDLEAGRLTRAESNINELKVKDAVLTVKVMILVGIIVSVGTIAMNLFYKYLETRL